VATGAFVPVGSNLAGAFSYQQCGIETTLLRAMSTRSSQQHASPYRLELLQRVPAHHRDALRDKRLQEGQLVYYGPHPIYYGIGEVKRINGTDVAVDFRGTGEFEVHEEIMDQRYLIRIPKEKLSEL
jgi:hypothetical protein